MSDLAQPAPGVMRPARAEGPPPRGKARNHSQFVRLLRWLLPLIMVAVVGVLAGLVGAHAIRRQAAAHKDASAPIRMVNPHFFGRDNQGRAYILGASQAVRDEASPQLVLLRDPTVTLNMEGAKPSTLTADTGAYHEDTRILLLKGHVRADNARTSRFATDEAVVDTRTGQVTGASALASQTPVGDLQSQSFDVFDKGDRVIFKGGVHAQLKGR